MTGLSISTNEQLIQRAAPQGHLAQLYEADEQVLVANVGHYLWEGLKRGDGLLVIATAEHREAFGRQLSAAKADPEAAVQGGSLVFLDAQETLALFMVDGQPDWGRFESTVGARVREMRRRAAHTGLRAYSALVGALWKARQFSAAARVEKFWNKLLEATLFNIFCSYPIDVFSDAFEMTALDELLCAHTHLIPAGANGNLERAINRAMDEILGSEVKELRLLIKANHRPSWAVIPRAEAIILWLRHNLPERVDEILGRARQYYQAAAHPSQMALPRA